MASGHLVVSPDLLHRSTSTSPPRCDRSVSRQSCHHTMVMSLTGFMALSRRRSPTPLPLSPSHPPRDCCSVDGVMASHPCCCILLSTKTFGNNPTTPVYLMRIGGLFPVFRVVSTAPFSNRTCNQNLRLCGIYSLRFFLVLFYSCVTCIGWL